MHEKIAFPLLAPVSMLLAIPCAFLWGRAARSVAWRSELDSESFIGRWQTSGSHGGIGQFRVSSRCHPTYFFSSVCTFSSKCRRRMIIERVAMGDGLRADDFKYYFRSVRIDFFRYLPLLFLCCLFFNYYLSCRQTRNGHAERRSTDVVHADLMAKFHAVRIAAMFAADADLEFGARLAPVRCPSASTCRHLGIE